MNILLVNPPSPFLDCSKCEPPLGILSIAGYLRAYNTKEANVRILDLGDTFDYEGTFSEHLQDFQPTIVGISCVTPQYPYAVRLCEIAKKDMSHPWVVAGGPHATCLPDTLPADTVVSGPGEVCMSHIVQMLLVGAQPPKFMVGDRTVKMTEPTWLPSRDLIDLHAYSRTIGGVPATTLYTSWGCPSNCVYCMKGTWRKFRLFSPEWVQLELEEIHDKYGYKAVLFIDDTFTYDANRLVDICKTLKRLDMKWRCWTRVDCVTPELLRFMGESGCAELSFGIESGSQKMLDIMNKGTTVAQNKQALKWSKAAGIKTKAFLMVGTPGETLETIQETKNLITECNPDQYILSAFTPIVGSPIWVNPEKYGILGFNKMDFAHQWEVGKGAQGGTYINTKWLSSEELRKAHDDLLEFLKNR